MNSELPLTRRDVVAFVVYALLAFNIVSQLLSLMCQIVSSHFFLFSSSVSGARVLTYAINTGAAFVVSLSLFPFVSLIAYGVAGKNASRAMTKKDVPTLLLPITGMVLFITGCPFLFSEIYYLWRLPTFYGNFASTARPPILQNIAISLATLSFGFALAFFPAIFGALRANSRDDESAA